MRQELLLATAALFLIDVALRPWKGKGAIAQNAIYLSIPYAPLLAIPFLPPLGVVALSGVVGLAASFSFARMVGLTQHPRFYAAALVCAASFYAVAPLDWYALFQAMPAFSIFLIAAVGSLKGEAHAFLQKLCLSWLIVLVYGYLWAHAALFGLAHWARFSLTGSQWLTLVIFIAKAADVAWVAARRVKASDATQLPASALGGVLGGSFVGWVHGATVGGLTWQQLTLLGLIVGAALGIGSRAFRLVVEDVAGEVSSEPKKGTMLFGFSFSLALAYHYIRYLS